VTTRDDILEAVRAWFVLAIPAITNTPATPDAPNQIIRADDKGPRPTPPYLTVKVSDADGTVGVDETQHAIDPGDPTGPSLWKVKGERFATIDLVGFSAAGTTTAAGWLEDAVLRLQRPDVSATIDAAGLSVITQGSTVDVSSNLDTQIERRHLRTLEVRYAVRDSGPGLPELETAETAITLERYDDHPDPLAVDVVVTL